MSYEIYFTLTTDQGEEETETAFNAIDKVESIFEIDIVPGEFAQGRAGRHIVSDMQEYSKVHPDVLYSMECSDSEENRWIDYYKNGKYTCCSGRIVYDEFKEENLS